MFLKRVKVSDFRVLKDVDLTFEPEFTPNIYPLGSLNGGGKSTLLQLIFTLLHCSFDESRHQYLVNLLSSSIKNKPDYFSLAEFEILHDNQEFSLEFIIVKNGYENLNFDCFEQIRKLKNRIERLENDIAHSESLLTSNNYDYGYPDDGYPIVEELEHFNEHLHELQVEQTYTESKRNKIIHHLNMQKLKYITYISSGGVLSYKTTNDANFIKNISNKIYLASPITQIFLFLSEMEKKSLFLSKTQENNYYFNVSEARENLTGLFTYDFAFINVIINAFIKARDKDFAEAVESNNYGNNLNNLKIGLNNFLAGKSITTNKELSQVIFKLHNTDEVLFPEDLSHGELKKLAIYVWLKYHDIKDALILMDEIEIGLHPDWQYEIINELQEWSNNNQFILATHSYELCQALTPSHVKELEPKLIKEK